MRVHTAVVDNSAYTQIEAYHTIPDAVMIEHEAQVKLSAEPFSHNIPSEGCRQSVNSATAGELAKQINSHCAFVQQLASLSMNEYRACAVVHVAKA